MALTKDQKAAQIKDLREDLKKTQSLAFMQYRGLTVAQVDDLRGQMLEKNAKMKVIKKTLFNIAAKEEGYPEIPEGALGDQPIAFIFSFEDMVSGAKVAFEFGKKNDAVELIGGVLDGKVLNKEEAINLAKMLSREEILAKFAAMLRAPLSSFASMSSSPLSSFARAVKEVAQQGGKVGKDEKVEKVEETPAVTEDAPKEEAKEAVKKDEEGGDATPESTDKTDSESSDS